MEEPLGIDPAAGFVPSARERAKKKPPFGGVWLGKLSLLKPFLVGRTIVLSDPHSTLVIILTNVLLTQPHSTAIILQDKPLAITGRASDNTNVTVHVLDFHS